MAKGQQERSRGQQAEEVEKRQGEDLVYMSERRCQGGLASYFVLDIC